MTKKLLASILSLSMLAAITSCNSSSTDSQSTEVYSSAAVTSFSLAADDDVLVGLDSVKFSINLVDRRIYNADSLPKGTDISALLVNISATASVAELTYKLDNGRDSVVNYIETTTDSINFANGPVQLRLVSIDKTTTCDYTITVNVHQMEPDSLYWNRTARRNLPSLFSVPANQKTTKADGTYYCLTSNGSQYCLATASHPETGGWENKYVTFGFNPDIESFTASGSALYILDDEGALYMSDDEGDSWQGQFGVKWSYIYGAYNNGIVGVERIGNDYYYTNFPAGLAYLAPDDFPVRGTSIPYEYATKWSGKSQLIMVGGVNKDGKRLNTTWAYDGERWGNISRTRRIGEIEGMCLVPYTICETDSTSWRYTYQTVLLAFGGRKSDSEMNTTTYISSDLGFNWRVADQLLQLPEYIPGMFGSQAFVDEVTNYADSRSADEWQVMPSVGLPAWFAVRTAPNSRASAEITEWDTPYIYMFGGYNSNYAVYNTVWRGAISRLEFKPIQ